MNEVPGRREHCFTSQRTSFESSGVVVERIHDVINEFLGEPHTPVVDRGGDWTQVDGGFLHYLHDRPFARDSSDE